MVEQKHTIERPSLDDHKTINVLLVEDEDFQRKLITEMLHSIDSIHYKVHPVDSLKLAIKQLTKVPIDIILLDLNLPDSNQDSTLDEMHQKATVYPIVVITGVDNNQVEYNAIKNGMQEYLVKGQFHAKDLHRFISHAIERHHLFAEVELERKSLSMLMKNNNYSAKRPQEHNLVAENEHLFKKLEYLANFDHITKLPNRLYFEDFLKRTVKQAARQNHQFAILFLDLDDFKNINNTYGYAVGDNLLAAVANRLRNSMRETDFLARLGGDEFGLILPVMNHDDVAAKVAKKILADFKLPFQIDNNMLYCDISIGIACYPQAGMIEAKLMKNADLALQRVKQSGHGHYQNFKAEFDKANKRRAVIANALHDAIKMNAFSLSYQPIVDLDTQQVVALEALIQWHDETLGDVGPNEFIPVAESSGLIVPITQWVIHSVCRQLSDWLEHNESTLPVCVNLSAIDLLQEDLATTIMQILNKFRLPASLLQIELTETALMENMYKATEQLLKLSKQGICISIDDFGTGYSSLSRLANMPFHALKIDMVFTQKLFVDHNAALIVKTIIALAKQFNLVTISEGIETEETYKLLKKSGCVLGQGFYFSKPLSASQVIPFVNASMKEGVDFSKISVNIVGNRIRELGHNFNNLLAGVKGYTEILKSQIPENHPIGLWLTQADEATVSMFELTQQLSKSIRQKDRLHNSAKSKQTTQAMVNLASQTAAALRKIITPLLCTKMNSLKDMKTFPNSIDDKYQKMLVRVFEIVDKMDSICSQLDNVA